MIFFELFEKVAQEWNFIKDQGSLCVMTQDFSLANWKFYCKLQSKLMKEITMMQNDAIEESKTAEPARNGITHHSTISLIDETCYNGFCNFANSSRTCFTLESQNIFFSSIYCFQTLSSDPKNHFHHFINNFARLLFVKRSNCFHLHSIDGTWFASNSIHKFSHPNAYWERKLNFKI